jgi:hypothetical protein
MSRSSIFSFDTLRLNGRTREAWVTVASMVMVLVVGELALRAFRPFDLFDDWEHPQVAAKLRTLTAYVAVRGGVDVLLLGNSSIMNVNVGLIEEEHQAAGLTVFNAGIGGATPETLRFILEHGVLPVARPDVLLIAIGPRDLRDVSGWRRGQDAPLLSHQARRHKARLPLDVAEVNLERASQVFRVRRQVRDTLSRGTRFTMANIEVDERGVRKGFTGRLPAWLGGAREFPPDDPYRSRYREYRVDEDGRWQDLVELIRFAKSEGMAVVLVTVPIAPAARSLFDDPDGDWAVYEEGIQRVGRATGVAVADAHRDLALPDDAFTNADHTNVMGDDRLARYLSAAVRTVLAGR